MTVTVTTGTRLHWGLLGTPGVGERWPSLDGDASLAMRRFGGAGMMIDSPTIAVRASRASAVSATGPSAERAASAARRVAESLGSDASLRVEVLACPEEHRGLGVGTQLALAAGQAAALALGHDPLTPADLATRVGRGLRSGIGAYGFGVGGVLVDAGKTGDVGLAPLACRVSFPDAWSVLLVDPGDGPGLSGDGERAAFAQLTSAPAQTEALCRLVLLGLVPALIEGDLATFGEALYDFNRRAGLLFKASQGGIYRSGAAEAIVAHLRRAGVAGVGQSSWGPTLFAIAEPERLSAVAGTLTGVTTRLVRGRNAGHAILHA